MQLADLDVVLRIEQEGHPVPWSRGVFEDCIAGRNQCLLAERDGEIVGFAIFSFIVDEFHLLNICVSSAMQGRGYGREFLNHLLSLAVHHSMQVIFLEVRASNKAAISLYHSHGFNEVGVRRDYYPAKQGREDAVLMTLDLSVDVLA